MPSLPPVVLMTLVPYAKKLSLLLASVVGVLLFVALFKIAVATGASLGSLADLNPWKKTELTKLLEQLSKDLQGAELPANVELKEATVELNVLTESTYTGNSSGDIKVYAVSGSAEDRFENTHKLTVTLQRKQAPAVEQKEWKLTNGVTVTMTGGSQTLISNFENQLIANALLQTNVRQTSAPRRRSAATVITGCDYCSLLNTVLKNGGAGQPVPPLIPQQAR